MIETRPMVSLGHHKNDWLNSRFHFSFADYHDPARMGLGPLRVWNDDEIQPGTGFPMHGHRDMEIITYVRSGAITHEDSLGNRGATGAGDIQVMHAGTGIVHSEYNLEDAVPTTLFQIWIEPARKGHDPGWQAIQFPGETGAGKLAALASGRGHADALTIHQDAALFGATLAAGETIVHGLGADRRAYLVAARGAIRVNGIAAATRDGVAISGEEQIEIAADGAECEVVLVDVP